MNQNTSARQNVKENETGHERERISQSVKKDRFIPLRKKDLLNVCLNDGLLWLN